MRAEVEAHSLCSFCPSTSLSVRSGSGYVFLKTTQVNTKVNISCCELFFTAGSIHHGHAGNINNIADIISGL